MELGGLGGGIVECGTERPMWLPYVRVESVEQVTACAWGMGRPCCSSRARGRPLAQRGLGARRRGAGPLAAEGGGMSLAGAELELLEAARRGDEDAYARLIGPHRAQLHAHCYRMLASAPDAEDALQEALLGAWRGLPRFEGRSSLRSWLYTIATNACLKAIERRPKRVLPVDYAPAADPHDGPGTPLVESVWVTPYPDADVVSTDSWVTPEARYEQRESIELAFIAALQQLPPRQRATLILRDVLGFSAREVASVLDTTTASVNSALQRAHRLVDERLPEQSQQAALRALGDDALSVIVKGYVDGLGEGRPGRRGGDAGRGCHPDDAADADLVRGTSSGRGLLRPPAAAGRPPLAPAAGGRQRPDRVRPLRLGRARRLLPAARRKRARPERITGQRDQRVPVPAGLRAVQPA
jgi:RNA polymerase sigma factor (sigma-70 family)